MEEGDFPTNPNWTWHEHINNSDQPVLWIDALDSPLMRFLEVGFHEPHETGKQAIAKSAGTTIAELSSIRPTWIKSDSVHPPGYRYRWADTEAALKVLGEKPGDPYDGVFLEYVNPLNGSPTLPTMSCGSSCCARSERPVATVTRAPRCIMCFAGPGRLSSTTFAMNGNPVTLLPYPSGNFTTMKIVMRSRPSCSCSAIARR